MTQWSRAHKKIVALQIVNVVSGRTDIHVYDTPA